MEGCLSLLFARHSDLYGLSNVMGTKASIEIGGVQKTEPRWNAFAAQNGSRINHWQNNALRPMR